jgi:amino acid transporter
MASGNGGSTAYQKIHDFLIGSPLQTQDLPHQTVSKKVGLAVFASDALSSTAYATDEILLYLGMTGLAAVALSLSLPIALAIAVLLVIVTISYRQTIFAYPNGGGAYIVARDNLGEHTAQVAGAALLTDYILTVAVSISSGVAQIASAFPVLNPYRVLIALGLIGFITLINLRGVKESGAIFSFPTYIFLGMMFLMLGVGAYRYFTHTLPTITGVEALAHDTLLPLSAFLVLRAFSSGCTALTGIEAISNGITAFQTPRSKNAAITLVWMSGILITLFLGITFLAGQMGAVHSEIETVISQLGRTLYGAAHPLYFLTLISTTAILIMAANTSYADFPRLAALHAGDGFLPRQLTYRGSRLVFSWGITILAIFASLLVIVTGARVSSLIPLYAIGVFLSFSISQTGMVVRMLKESKLKPGEILKGLETDLTYDPNWRLKIVISALGAVCTFVVMVVFAVTKFWDGAWVIVVLVPVLVFIFFQIHGHYKSVAQSLSLQGIPAYIEDRPVQTLILIDSIHRETMQMVNFAQSLGHPWLALHVGTSPERTKSTQERWEKYIVPHIKGEGRLEIVPSPYRALAAPIREYIEAIIEKAPNTFVHVIMGHLAMDNFWEQALHQNTDFIFNLALGDMDNVAVTIIPYRVHAEGKAERIADSHQAEPGARAHHRDTGELKLKEKQAAEQKVNTDE